jgi:3-deoxy-alpha-D-manno-octulosonate 8-oxidase
MLKRHGIVLPRGVTRSLSAEAMDRMVAMTLRMERPLTNALGENWREHMTRDRILELYGRM